MSFRIKLRLKQLKCDIRSQLAGDMQTAFDLTVAGVAFLRQDNKAFEVYSHWGDYIGSIPTYLAHALICKMRRTFGINKDSIPPTSYIDKYNFTYGWKNLIADEQMQTMMEEMWRKPIELT